MPDLDYAKVTGRFGLSIGDTPADPDDNPDLIWCTEGKVLLTPLNTFVKVTGSAVPFTMGNAVYECNIAGPDYVDPTGAGNSGSGRLVFNGPYGQPFVNVVDLTSDKVNPKIGTDSATHRVTFVGVKATLPGTATKVDVSFPSFTARITAAGPNGDGINDLTLLAPVVPGELQPIYQGPAGASVDTAAVDSTGALVFTLTNGATKKTDPLPGTASSVADYINTPGGPVAAALAASIAQLKVWARNPDLLISGAVTRDGNGAATSAPVTWPDGTPGIYAATTVSTAFPGAVDGYTVTYGSPVMKTYTQPTITRDATSGAATNVPAITVA